MLNSQIGHRPAPTNNTSATQEHVCDPTDSEEDEDPEDCEDSEDVDDSEIPPAELPGSRLEWSTIAKESRGCRESKSCTLCGKSYQGGPRHIRIHLDKTLKPRDVKQCVPKVCSHDMIMTSQ